VEEFRSHYLTYRPSGMLRSRAPVVEVTGAPPTDFDWRDKNAVTAVKDQGAGLWGKDGVV
jgi:C1A family cysteine protease